MACLMHTSSISLLDTLHKPAKHCYYFHLCCNYKASEVPKLIFFKIASLSVKTLAHEFLESPFLNLLYTIAGFICVSALLIPLLVL